MVCLVTDQDMGLNSKSAQTLIQSDDVRHKHQLAWHGSITQSATTCHAKITTETSPTGFDYL